MSLYVEGRPREHVEVRVYEGVHYVEEKWPPVNLIAFSDFIQEQIQNIPEEFRANAWVELGACHAEYEDNCEPEFIIAYWKPMDDFGRDQKRRNEEIAREAEKAALRNRLAQLERM